MAAAENVRAPRGGGAGSSRSAVCASAVLAGAALFAGAAAHAGSFDANNDISLVGAFLNADASPDAASTVNLLSNITSGATVPPIQKNVTVVPNGFTLTFTTGQPFFVGVGSSLTFLGSVNITGGLSNADDGTLVFDGAASKAGGDINVGSGQLRIQNGATLTPGGTSRIQANGPNSSIVVTGAGSRMILNGGDITIGSGAGSSLSVLAGGAFTPPGGISNLLLLGDAVGTTGNLTVQGTGSIATVSTTSTTSGTSNINVLDGGRFNTSAALLGGTATTFTTGVSHVAVDGAGSVFFNGAGYTQQNGTLVVSNGGSVQVTTNLVLGGADGGSVTGLVTGVGSSLATTKAGAITLGQAGEATVTVANGGTITSKNGTAAISMGQTLSGSGTLNIGAAVGDASAAPGKVAATAIVGGDGTAVVNFNHNAANYDFAVPIQGSTSVNQIGSGTTTLTGLNTYTGATNVAAGTLRAGAASVFSAASDYTVASGATLDLAGNNQAIASMKNAGTVSLVGGAPGTTLTVNGAWVGNGGTLRLGTALGTSASASDRLILNGPTAIASGTTNVAITNLGGLGALTTGNGIEVITALGGATTTAQTTKSAFALSGGHVDAGAYQYRLFAADAAGAGENWYLRSSIEVPPVAGGTTGTLTTGGGLVIPTYRNEVPLYAALPEQLRQANLSMLGNMHQRVGDDGVSGANTASPEQGYRQVWARVISTDRTISQAGTVSPTSKGRLTGFQAGTDLWANPNWRAGVYVGQLDGDMSVTGFASGLQNFAVGSNDLRNQYFGAYGTWKNADGFYVDTVLQAGRHRYTVSPALSYGSSGKGSSLLASVEAGKAFRIAPQWVIEPQVQLVHQRVSLDNTAIVGATVQQNTHSGWLARAGVRVKGELPTGAGLLQPYVRVNVYRSNKGTDVTRFIGPAAFTDIATRTGGTSSELAAGATLQLTPKVAVYGEVGKLWASSGGARNKSSVDGSVGVKFSW